MRGRDEGDFAALSRAGLFAEEALGAAPAAERLARVREEVLLVALAPGLGRRGQLILATLLNLVGRLFDFVGPIDLALEREEAEPGVFGWRNGFDVAHAARHLLRRIHVEAREADVEIAAKRGPYRRAILIGGVERDDVEEAIHVDASGWVAAVGPKPHALPAQRPDDGNPFGCVAAAALAASELARSLFRAIAGPQERERFAPLADACVWNLWSHAAEPLSDGPPIPSELELGRFGVAGVGAVGSAVLLALANLPRPRGRVELVDDDALSVTNLERVVIGFGHDVGSRKASLGRRALLGTRLRSVVIPDRYGRELPHGAQASTLLVGVDSGVARQLINRHLPEAVYNGGTQGGEILVSRHVRYEGACVECLYPESRDPVGRTARRLGVDRATAAALVAGERTFDAEILRAMQARGGIHVDGGAERLLGKPLAELEARVCSRAAVIEDLPEATIGYVAALCGFLIASEFVKDRLPGSRPPALDTEHCAFRLDLLAQRPGPLCLEHYVPRRTCWCQVPEVRARIEGLKRGAEE